MQRLNRAIVVALWALFVAPVWAGPQYTYDELGRVRTVTYDNGTQTTYTYDPAGNRQEVKTASSGNHPPTAVADSVTIYEDETSKTFSPHTNDTDPDSDTLNIFSIGDALYGTTSSTASTITYTPNTTRNADEDIIYVVRDRTDASALTDSGLITVHLANKNPTAVADSVTTPRNTPLVFNPLSNDTDPGNDALVIDTVVNGTKGTVTKGTNGLSLTYQPNQNAYGTDSFTYNIKDADDGSAQGTVTVTIPSTNQAPVAVDDYIHVGGVYPLTTLTYPAPGDPPFDPTANDTDADGTDVLVITSVSGSSKADITIAGDGKSLLYAYDVGLVDGAYYDEDTFTYTISDGQTTSTATVHVDVNVLCPECDRGTYQFSSSTASVAESAGQANLTVTRTGGDAGSATVMCATANGTATSGSDYTFTNTALTWHNGESASKTCSIPISDDSSPESSETFTATLSSSVALGTPTTATVTIADNDPPGTLAFSSATYSLAENGGSVALTVTRTGGSSGAASVTCATNGSGTATSGTDYTATTTTLNWAAGDATSKTCTIPITNDSTYEASETFNVTLSNATVATLGSPSTTTVTITNDDPLPAPATPASLQVQQGGCPSPTHVPSWSASTYATYYELWRQRNEGTWTLRYSGSNLTYSDSASIAGNYDYKVRACNTTGCSAYTSEVRAVSPTCTNFMAPAPLEGS